MGNGVVTALPRLAHRAGRFGNVGVLRGSNAMSRSVDAGWFGKPGSWVALIVFAICWIWSIIGLAISASYGFATSGGYGLGVTGGVLGFLILPLMGLWLCWTTLNEISILWIVSLVVVCVACLFLLIAGIIFATVAWSVPAALDIVAAITLGVGIFFWIRSRGLVPDVGVSSEGAESGQYQEW